MMTHPARTVLLIAAIGFAFLGWARWRSPSEPEPTISWYPTYPLALEAARKSGDPLLVYFQASWCAVCRRLERESFSDPNVARAFRSWTAVKLDVDREKALADRFQVAGVPALLLMDERQAVTARLWGFIDAHRLAASLGR